MDEWEERAGRAWWWVIKSTINRKRELNSILTGGFLWCASEAHKCWVQFTFAAYTLKYTHLWVQMPILVSIHINKVSHIECHYFSHISHILSLIQFTATVFIIFYTFFIYLFISVIYVLLFKIVTWNELKNHFWFLSIYNTVQTFERSLFCSPRLHLFD